MRRLSYPGDGAVRVEEVPRPSVGPGHALVRITASALCGSERSALLRGRAGNSGHEAAGVIEAIEADGAVGGRVTFQAGDAVGLSAVTGCGSCDRCRAGRETQCRSGPAVGGNWHAEYAAVPVAALRRVVPDDPVTAVLQAGDGLGVPARVARRFPPPPGGDVVVLGLGPVGLGHVLVQAFAGARVIGIEPSPYRREQALRLGAAEVHAPGDYGGRPGTVIECTGVPAVIESAFALVDSSGLVIQSGECQQAVSLVPSDLVVHREVTYSGSWFYASEDYPSMTRLLADGLPLRDLCTHEVPAAGCAEAVTAFLDGLTGKVVLRW